MLYNSQCLNQGSYYLHYQSYRNGLIPLGLQQQQRLVKLIKFKDLKYLKYYLFLQEKETKTNMVMVCGKGT